MYLEAKETAHLYKLLTERLGNDTTEAMFKYIDNKTERSVEATIKTLATKDDIANIRQEMGDGFANIRKEMSDGFADLLKETGDDIADLRKEMRDGFSNSRKEINNAIINVQKDMSESAIKLHKEIGDSIKWMFVFWIGQVGALLGILLLFIKK